MNEEMNWIAERTMPPSRLEEIKQIVKNQSPPQAQEHSALIASTLSRGKSTVARGNNSG